MSQSQSGFFVLNKMIENVNNLAALCTEAAEDLSDFRSVHYHFHFFARKDTLMFPCMNVAEFCGIIKELVNTRKVNNLVFAGAKENIEGGSPVNGVVFGLSAGDFPLNIEELLMPTEENASNVLALDLMIHPNWPFSEDAVLSNDYIVSGDTIVFLLCKGGGRIKHLETSDCRGIPTSTYRVFCDGGEFYPLFNELIFTGYADHNLRKPIVSITLPWNTKWSPKYIIDQKVGTVFRVVTNHPEVMDEDDVQQRAKLDCIRIGWVPFTRDITTDALVTCELINFPVNRRNSVMVENLLTGEKSK